MLNGVDPVLFVGVGRQPTGQGHRLAIAHDAHDATTAEFSPYSIKGAWAALR